MPEANQDQQGQQNNVPQDGAADSQYNPPSLEDAQKIIAALEKRVSEREATIGNLNERLTAIEQARRQQLEESGNWEQIAKQHQKDLETIRPYQERAQTLEAIIRQSNEERLKRIPENKRKMVPLDYAPEKLQTWLNDNEAELVNPPPPRYDGGAGNGGSGSREVVVTDADRSAALAARAQGYNISAEDIAKRRLEQNNTDK